MLICDNWFHAVYMQPSWSRKKNILEESKKTKKKKKKKKYCQKNVYVRIAYNCVCVDYVCVLLYEVVYVVVSMCVYDGTCAVWQI